MPNVTHHKVLGSLPGVLEENSIYFVKVGNAFDVYVTDAGQDPPNAIPLKIEGKHGVAVLNFVGGAMEALTVISGQTGITATSSIQASIICLDTPTHPAEDHLIEDIEVKVGFVVPNTSFAIYARSRNVPLIGQYSVQWSWR